MLAALVGKLDNPIDLATLLHALGERHRGYSVEARHFAPVGRALFETLESEIGPRFDGATRRAWIALYALATSWMHPPSGDHESLW
jgi:hemoglobin-like flavoprotein